MLLSPIQNKAVFDMAWLQKRPYITQKYGARPEVYKQFGMDGHDGTDYRAAVGTPLFAPMDGIIKVKDSGKAGYGLHIKIRNEFKLSEVVLGHLSDVQVVSGQRIQAGDLIGYSGDSGFSDAAHLHVAFRKLKEGTGDIFTWPVMDYNNGYFGYIDVAEWTLCWKGTVLKNTL